MVKIITSSNLRDAVIKSVLEEYEVKSQEISKDDLNYGTEAITPPYNPFVLDELSELSGLHETCLEVKAEDTVFSGMKIVNDNDLSEDLKEFLEDFQFLEELEAFVLDFQKFGYAGLELLRDDAGQLQAVNRISSLYIRMCKDKKRVLQKIGTHQNYFKVYNPGDTSRLNRETGIFEDNITDETIANDLIWYNSKSNESKVHGKPEYLSEVEAITTDDAIVKYQKGHFKSHGVPNYIITVTGNVDTDDDEYSSTDFERDLEDQFRNVTNEPGTALCVVIPTDGMDNKVAVNVTKIGEERKEGSFLELSKSISDRIRRVHKVPSERLGDSESTGIASNRTSTLLKNYSKHISNMQKRIANLINRTLIKNEFNDTDVKIEFLEANFEAEDVQLERGIKLLQNGALTLGEFINRFAEPYGVSMDENDELYDCRFMNNQSLDTVLYGNSPMDAEGKLNEIINNLGEDFEGVNPRIFASSENDITE